MYLHTSWGLFFKSNVELGMVCSTQVMPERIPLRCDPGPDRGGIGGRLSHLTVQGREGLISTKDRPARAPAEVEIICHRVSNYTVKTRV